MREINVAQGLSLSLSVLGKGVHRLPVDYCTQHERGAQAIADQLQGGDMALDYDQILAKRPASEDAIFAW